MFCLSVCVYRSVWDREGNKPATCQRRLLEPVSLTVEISRNLSSHWYHGMPTLSVDAKLGPLLVLGVYCIMSLAVLQNLTTFAVCELSMNKAWATALSTMHVMYSDYVPVLIHLYHCVWSTFDYK